MSDVFGIFGAAPERNRGSNQLGCGNLNLNEIEGVMPGGMPARARGLGSHLTRLLSSPAIRFDDRCRSKLPAAHGIYRIFDPRKPEETIRAGRTKSAAGGLRQRVYQNHLMGTQPGNLRAQLVADGICADLASAKRYVQENLAVQILAAENAEERIWLEHFVLGVLQPRYCD